MAECPDCGKDFDTERGMKIHKTRVHGKEEQEKEVEEDKLKEEKEEPYQAQEDQVEEEEREERIKKPVSIILVIIIIVAFSLSIITMAPIFRDPDDPNGVPEDPNNETDELNETDQNISYEDLYRPPENTLYFICDFENETTKEERCINNLRTARTFAEERNISFIRRDTRANQSEDIMRGIGVARYPLWVYNTEETPEDKYCALVGGPVNNYILQEFIDHCEEFGTLEEGHFEV